MSAQEILAGDPIVAAEQEPPAKSTRQDPGRNLRLITLLTILGLLLFAAWYDHKVARPGVDRAFDIVGHLNSKINRSAAAPAMRSSDVQQALGLTPSYIIPQGPYRIEVYAWTAGLPFRSHDYFAVYEGTGTNPVFRRHYKFVLPMEELNPRTSGPQVALAGQGASGRGPNPFEATGNQWDPEAQQAEELGESIERLAIPARGDRTDPDEE